MADRSWYEQQLSAKPLRRSPFAEMAGEPEQQAAPAAANEPSSWQSSIQNQKKKDYQKQTRAQALGPDEWIDIQNRSATDPTFTAQRQGIGEMREALKKIQGEETQVDLKPLMQFADWYTDDKHGLAKRYSEPTLTPEKKKAIEQMLQGNILKAQQDLGRQENEFRKAQITDRMIVGSDESTSDTQSSGTKVGPAFSQKAQQANRNKFSSDKNVAQANGLIKLKGLVKNYQDSLNKYNGPQIKGEGRRLQKQAHKALLVAWNKYEAELGALSGDDKGILEEIVSMPTTTAEWIEHVRSGGADGLQGQIAAAMDMVDNNFTNVYSSIENTYHPESGTRGQIKDLTDRYRGSVVKRGGPKKKRKPLTDAQRKSLGL